MEVLFRLDCILTQFRYISESINELKPKALKIHLKYARSLLNELFKK